MANKQVLAVFVATSFVILPGELPAGDWPQYRGPNQNGISTEKVNWNWPESGPKMVWKVPTRQGFSSFAVGGGKVFTQVVRDLNGAPREGCLALDAETGKELWFTDVAVGTGYSGGGDGDGPRSTPTVNDGLVYVLPPSLALHCLDAQTGKILWTRDLIKEHAGRNIGWNSAASPAVDGDLVFLGGGGPGQSLLGLNKKNGQVVWKAHDEKITHSTPVVATIQGVRQVIFFVQSGLLSVSAENGKALWKFPFRYNVSTAISPVVEKDIVYCSAGYGVGSGACKITKSGDQFSAQELYKIAGDKDNKETGKQHIANHWSTPVVKDGYLYGMFSFKEFGNGPLKCVELATGQVKWRQPGFGAGHVILVNDKILALADDGRLVVVEPTPTGYKEVARAKVVNGKCWSTPAISNGRIYVRSTKEGVCLDVSGK
jgi:outer membrane protein assembly factor BamB